MADDEFENFDRSSTLGDPRGGDGVDTFLRMLRHTGYNILKAGKTPASLRRKRLSLHRPKIPNKLFAA